MSIVNQKLNVFQLFDIAYTASYIIAPQVHNFLSLLLTQ